MSRYLIYSITQLPPEKDMRDICLFFYQDENIFLKTYVLEKNLVIVCVKGGYKVYLIR